MSSSSTNGSSIIKPPSAQKITIHDTPSPIAAITISDSEDEEPPQPIYGNNLYTQIFKFFFILNLTFFLLTVPAKNNRTTDHHGRSMQKSSSSCNINSSRHSGVINNNNNNSGNDSQRSQRKNVISCVTVPDSDGEERRSPKTASKCKFKYF